MSAALTIGVNGPASASIQIVPLDQGTDLKPRTMVHLFFMDHAPLAKEKEEAIKRGVREEDLERAGFKLLFTGEVIGFAFTQSPMARGLVLQCVDFSSYWDAVHATAMEYGPNGNAFNNQSSIYGSNAALFDDIVNFQSEMLVSWLRQQPLTPGLQQVSGLAGGIIRMLEAIGGVPTHHKGVNDFFTFSELRGRILAQITAEEKDDTARRILQGKVFDEWLRNGLQNIGQQVTFRDMVKLLCRYIYYDVVPNPVAKYDFGYDGGSERTTSTSSISESPLAIKAAADLVTQISNLNGLESELPATVKNATGAVADVLEQTVKDVAKLGSAANVPKFKIQNAASNLRILQQTFSIQTPSTEDITRTITTARSDLAEARKFLVNSDTKVTVTTGVKSTATTARLRTQILRPDCYFAAAPRCNVIFPEHFSQVSYDRAYLTEVTRSLTMVYNTLVGRDELLADKIMAPNIGLDMAKIQRQVGNSSYRVLMPHERHTGIIPRTEWLPNTAAFDKSQGKEKMRGARLNWVNRAALFHFFKYRFGPRRVSIAGKFNPFVVCGFPAVVILKPFQPKPEKLREVLKLAADAAIDDQAVLDAVQTNASALEAPYQLVGMVGSIQHNIDQSGGTTSLMLHHARRHLGADDEFVNIFSEKETTSKRRVKVPLVFDKVAASTDPKLMALLVGVTPQDDKIQKSKKVLQTRNKTKDYTKDTLDPATGKIVTVSKSRDIQQTTEVVLSNSDDPVQTGRIDGSETDVLTPSPTGTITRGAKGRFGTIVGVQVVSSDRATVASGTYKGKKAFREVILHEDVTIGVTESIPVEEIIRPSWFSPNYSNPKIGKNIYMPFFGTTSIIDELAFTGLTADELFSPENPDGDTFDPTQKLQEVQQSLVDKDKSRSRLSIERAINVIAYLYGMVKINGKDVDQYVREYGQRPIATMIDILGSSDFSAEYGPTGAITSTTGTAGFHSIAVDRKSIELGNLTGLLEDPNRQLPRINNQGKKAPISPVYDVRNEKLQKVDAYIRALKAGPGLQG